ELWMHAGHAVINNGDIDRVIPRLVPPSLGRINIRITRSSDLLSIIPHPPLVAITEVGIAGIGGCRAEDGFCYGLSVDDIIRHLIEGCQQGIYVGSRPRNKRVHTRPV